MFIRVSSLLAVAAMLAACGGGGGGGGSSASTPPAPSGSDASPAGDIPDNQAYVRFTPSGARFSVKVPEGWSQTSKPRDIRFSDKLNTIELTWDAAVAPAPANAKVSAVKRTAGQARRATYLAAGQPDPVTGKKRVDAVERYEFTHSGRTVVLTLSGPKGADNVDPWRIVTDSLRWR